MYCPRCNAHNDAGYQFCQSCGLDLSNVRPPVRQQQTPGHYLFVSALRFVVMLFALWITRSLLTGVSFVHELVIPDFPLTTVMIVNLIVYGFIVFLLVQFAVIVSRYWPVAFPGFAGVSTIFTAILYVILLNQVYRGLLPILRTLTPDREPVMALQIVLLLAALVLVVRALIMLYHHLPVWISAMRVEPPPMPAPIQTAPADSNPKPAAQAS